MSFLNQPYPYYHQGKSLIKLTFLLFIVGYLFEYLIMPFPRNPEEHKFNYEIISLFHIGVAAVIYFIYFSIVSQFVQEDDWKVSKELIAVLFLLICIGIGEWGIRPVIYHNDGNMSSIALIEEIWHAFLAGGLIYLIVTLVNLQFLVQQHSKTAMTFSSSLELLNGHLIDIQTQNAADDFKLNPDELICVQADGNYLEFYIKSNDGVNKNIKRITLLSLSNQLSEVPTIIKTHRAYLVNTNYIAKVEGNAQGYKLTLEGIDFNIPVSRKHLESFDTLVQ